MNVCNYLCLKRDVVRIDKDLVESRIMNVFVLRLEKNIAERNVEEIVEN